MSLEPQSILVKAAIAALGASGRDLRARGWDAELVVDYVAERDTYVVSLRVELPAMPVPIEATS